MFISFLDAVGNLSIWPDVTIRGDNPIHRVSLHDSLFLGPLTLRELDLVNLLQEQGSVVILIEDLDDDPDGGGFGRNTVVSNSDLRKNNRTRALHQEGYYLKGSSAGNKTATITVFFAL